MGKSKHGKQMGPPKIVWSDGQYRDFEKLCEIHATEAEVLSWFNIDDMTLNRLLRLRYDATYSEVFPRFAGRGKVSLRRTLFLAALGHQVNIEVDKEVDELDKDGKPTGKNIMKKVVEVQKVKPDFRAMKWLSTNHLGMAERVSQKIEVEERRVVEVDLSWADESSGNQLEDQNAKKDTSSKKV